MDVSVLSRMGTRVIPDKSLSGVHQLLEDLQRLLDDHDSADILFLVGREEVPIYAHRIILMTRYGQTLQYILNIYVLLVRRELTCKGIRFDCIIHFEIMLTRFKYISSKELVKLD